LERIPLSKVPGAGPSGIAGFAATLRRLEGAAPFELAEVVRELSLTDAQQLEIQKIVEACNQRLQQVDTYAPGASRHERSRKRVQVLTEARHNAIAVLSPEQQMRWENLMCGHRL
jgi:hypothetical protein